MLDAELSNPTLSIKLNLQLPGSKLYCNASPRALGQLLLPRAYFQGWHAASAGNFVPGRRAECEQEPCAQRQPSTALCLTLPSHVAQQKAHVPSWHTVPSSPTSGLQSRWETCTCTQQNHPASIPASATKFAVLYSNRALKIENSALPFWLLTFAIGGKKS